MEIHIREDGAVLTEREFRARHATTSFPPILTADLLDSFGADPVFEGPQPTLTRYQTAARTGIHLDGGMWFTRWVAVDMDADAITAMDAQQAAAVRADRTQRLKDCDWTMLAYAPISFTQLTTWAEYRQALRDVPAQPGFPWDVSWPQQP